MREAHVQRAQRRARVNGTGRGTHGAGTKGVDSAANEGEGQADTAVDEAGRSMHAGGRGMGCARGSSDAGMTGTRRRIRIRGCLLIGGQVEHAMLPEIRARPVKNAERTRVVSTLRWSVMGAMACSGGRCTTRLAEVRTRAEGEESTLYQERQQHGESEGEIKNDLNGLNSLNDPENQPHIHEGTPECNLQTRGEMTQAERENTSCDGTNNTNMNHLSRGQGGELEWAIMEASKGKTRYAVGSRWHERSLIEMLTKIGSPSLQWRYGDG